MLAQKMFWLKKIVIQNNLETQLNPRQPLDS